MSCPRESSREPWAGLGERRSDLDLHPGHSVSDRATIVGAADSRGAVNTVGEVEGGAMGRGCRSRVYRGPSDPGLWPVLQGNSCCFKQLDDKTHPLFLTVSTTQCDKRQASKMSLPGWKQREQFGEPRFSQQVEGELCPHGTGLGRRRPWE